MISVSVIVLIILNERKTLWRYIKTHDICPKSCLKLLSYHANYLYACASIFLQPLEPFVFMGYQFPNFSWAYQQWKLQVLCFPCQLHLVITRSL